MLCAKVRREEAEAARKELSALRLLDKSHLIADEGGSVIIPLSGAPPADVLARHGLELVERAPVSRPAKEDPIDTVRSTARIPEPLKPLLPSKWEQLGDVGVIRLDSKLDSYESEIARAYAEVLRLKTVLRDVGGVSGEYRQPVTRTLLGTDTEAVHLENGIRYKLDVAKLMFSSGNVEERLRMAEVQCDGETVVDMFAGIGYFSLPMAVYQKPKKVIACEINPIAFRYLQENIALNLVSRIVKPVLGDNRELAGEGIADRVIMGYVKTTHEHLPAAVRLVRDGGIIHYHETCPNELLPRRPVDRLMAAVGAGTVDVLRMKEIKSYAPGVSHVVLDVRVTKRA
jgi:tRNA wybutosine-synthesizing protein 2